MVSKPILLKKGKLRILVDSRSLDNLLSKGDQNTRTLLRYSRCELFEFVRTPLNTDHDELRGVPALIEEYDDKGNLIGIEIMLDECQSPTAFNYIMQDVEEIGKPIHDKESLSADEKEAVIGVFIQAALNRVDGMNVMVTDNEVLLRNRLWFESHFPGHPLNIATVEEAKEIWIYFQSIEISIIFQATTLAPNGSGIGFHSGQRFLIIMSETTFLTLSPVVLSTF